ncbi:MAG TPA: hypothetical protein VMY34_00590 [Acidimicrobiales bacterium]|nr:hypothetical protein [Acidimicrobiales bacterium]
MAMATVSIAAPPAAIAHDCEQYTCDDENDAGLEDGLAFYDESYDLRNVSVAEPTDSSCNSYVAHAHVVDLRDDRPNLGDARAFRFDGYLMDDIPFLGHQLGRLQVEAVQRAAGQITFAVEVATLRDGPAGTLLQSSFASAPSTGVFDTVGDVIEVSVPRSLIDSLYAAAGGDPADFPAGCDMWIQPEQVLACELQTLPASPWFALVNVMDDWQWEELQSAARTELCQVAPDHH